MEQPQVDRGIPKFLLIFGLGWTIFGLIFVMIAILVVRGEINRYNQLLQEGQVVRAIITDLRVDTSDESPGYYVSYEYEAPVRGDPEPFSKTEAVPADFYHSLHLDQRIEVIYAASDPNTAQLKSQVAPPDPAFGWIFGGLGMLFLMVGLVIVFFGLRIWWKSTRP